VDITEFWRIFGAAILVLGGAFYAYVSWTKAKIQGLEGSVTAMKEREKEQDTCIKSLQGKEGDEMVRDYRTGEIERKLGALSEQVAAGFAEIKGATNASNMQIALILERQGNTQATVDEIRKVVASHERILAKHGLIDGEVEEP